MKQGQTHTHTFILLEYWRGSAYVTLVMLKPMLMPLYVNNAIL